MNFSTQDRKLTEQEKNARAGLNYAISLHLQGNKSGAVKAIRQALVLDPSLAREKLTLNLAQELTGLPSQEALVLLTNSAASQSLVKSVKKDDRRAVKAKPAGISTYFLVFFMLVLAGMVVFGLVFGKFDSIPMRLRLTEWETLRSHKSGGYDYYLFLPEGTAPEGGWPVVVILHGLGGQASELAFLEDTFTDAGAICIAPTFPGYEPYPGDGPIEPFSQLLKEISEEYPVQSRGAILLGMSQGGTFAFRFSLRHPEQVYSVVTAGAPEFDQDFSSPSAASYYFTWGELDGMQNSVIPREVRPLQQAGYNIKTYVIPGYGHEMTPFAIDLTLNIIQ